MEMRENGNFGETKCNENYMSNTFDSDVYQTFLVMHEFWSPNSGDN